MGRVSLGHPEFRVPVSINAHELMDIRIQSSGKMSGLQMLMEIIILPHRSVRKIQYKSA